MKYIYFEAANRTRISFTLGHFEVNIEVTLEQ
jgi:hypothetical protein